MEESLSKDRIWLLTRLGKDAEMDAGIGIGPSKDGCTDSIGPI